MTETLLQRAERIARAAHAGQRDLVGDYHQHLERVVALVEGDDAKAVAWLHDVLEDTPLTADDLRAAGISEKVVFDVVLLTRTPPYAYLPYVRTIRNAGSPEARAVKVADLIDHLRPLDPPVLKPERRRVYARALRTLQR